MKDYDPLKNDSYAKHLGEFNQAVGGVVSRENIYNQKGAILVRSGEKLNNSTIEKLLKHRLMKPIQDSVHIENAYSGDMLYQEISEWISQYSDLKAIHESNRIEKPLKTMCNIYAKQKTFQQMITVLAQQLPTVFERGFFCAWLSISISQTLQLSPTDAIGTFMAALSHDIGLLHIPVEIATKTTELTPEEWQLYQTHPIIGQVIAKSISGINKLVPKAILEHHECCDGTGFPAGKSEDKLLVAGQIIALCDEIYPLRINDHSHKTSLKNLQAFLQINHTTHMHSNYAALMAIINKAQLTPTTSISDDELPDYCTSLLNKYELLTVWAKVINQVMKKIPDGATEKVHTCAQKIYLHIVYIVKSSGLFNLGIKRWIEHLSESPSPEAGIEIEEINLMYDEVLRHIKKLHQQILLIHTEASNNGNLNLAKDTELLTTLDENNIPSEYKNQQLDIEKIL